MFFGNLLVFFTFQGKTHIDVETRTIVFSVLVAVGILGTVMLACLRRPIADQDVATELTAPATPRQAFLDAIQLFKTKRMILLSITFVYTGKKIDF